MESIANSRSCKLCFLGHDFFLAEDNQLGMEDRLNQPRKLGLLAGTFEDGSLSVFVVPHPKDIQPPDAPGPIYGEERNRS